MALRKRAELIRSYAAFSIPVSKFLLKVCKPNNEVAIPIRLSRTDSIKVAPAPFVSVRLTWSWCAWCRGGLQCPPIILEAWHLPAHWQCSSSGFPCSHHAWWWSCSPRGSQGGCWPGARILLQSWRGIYVSGNVLGAWRVESRQMLMSSCLSSTILECCPRS